MSYAAALMHGRCGHDMEALQARPIPLRYPPPPPSTTIHSSPHTVGLAWHMLAVPFIAFYWTLIQITWAR